MGRRHSESGRERGAPLHRTQKLGPPRTEPDKNRMAVQHPHGIAYQCAPRPSHRRTDHGPENLPIRSLPAAATGRIVKVADLL